ncbi:MAG: hypothetical protein ACPG4U_03965 [Pseudomonadales bacterium]
MKHYFNLYSSSDEWGEIHVISDGECNFLTFGHGGQQSGMQLLAPDRLLFQYTQAMMLAMVFKPNAGTALLLGLGAGSLAKALLKASDEITLHAIELRQSVIEVAHNWFELPFDDRLDIEHNDAFAYVAHCKAQYELLFVDLYLDEGLQTTLADHSFINHCYRSLEDEGVLIINLWDEGKGYVAFDLQQLEAVFQSRALTLVTDEGNIIVLIAKQLQLNPLPRNVQNEVKALGSKLDIPLPQLFNQLQLRH